MNRRTFSWLALGLVLTVGSAIPAAPPADTISFTGTVAWKDLEGGCYVLEADDGQRYVPMNLAAEYKSPGLRVQVTARLRPDMAGIQMAGRLIEILEISKLPPPGSRNPQP